MIRVRQARGQAFPLRPERQELDEDRAEDEPGEAAETTDDDADEEEDRERDRERVRIDEGRGDGEERLPRPPHTPR